MHARLSFWRRKMEWRGKAADRRPGGGGGRDGRLRMAALVGGQAVVRVLGSASLGAGAVDHRRASSGVGCAETEPEQSSRATQPVWKHDGTWD